MKDRDPQRSKNDLGPLLRRLRLSRGRTQDEVVERLCALGWSCDRSKYGKIEAQMVRVTDFQIVYFGHLFGDEFKEAFWRIQRRTLRTEAEMTDLSVDDREHP